MPILPWSILQELSQSLCNFDKRTIELLLTRAEKNQPPLHLSDLGTAELMETFGRERRHRYYTVSAFRSLAARERLDDSATGYANVDFSVVGGFAVVDPELFYDDEASLITYTDKPKETPSHKSKNPILPDGNLELKRPRKVRPEGVARKCDKRKRKDDDEEQADEPSTKEIPEKRPIGRPRKKPRLDADNHAVKSNTERLIGVSGQGELDSTKGVTPKKRRRLQKNQPSGGPEETAGQSLPVGGATAKHRGQKNQPSDILEEAGADRADEGTSLGGGLTLIPRKRGRPRKQMVDEPSSMHSTTSPSSGFAPFSPESSRPAKRKKPTSSQQVSSPVAVLADFPADVLDLVSMSGREVVVTEPQTEEVRSSARTQKLIARDSFGSPIKPSLPFEHPQPVSIANAVESQLPPPARTRATGSKGVVLDTPLSLPALTPLPSPESQDEADISYAKVPVMLSVDDHQPVSFDAVPEVCQIFFLFSDVH